MQISFSKPIQEIFSEIPKTYEFLNRMLTFGLDEYWRKSVARFAALNNGNRWLDVCSGTGQMARCLSTFAKDSNRIIALDFCLPMLREVPPKKDYVKISLCAGDAAMLPFPENSFDLITISFATRNINTTKNNLLRCLKEFNRVLKPGGRFINLETSQPPSYFVRKFFYLYIRTLVKPVGYLISGSKKAYAYLASTIPRFFAADELSQIIREAGFSNVKYDYLTWGVVAIHTGLK